jgi:D-glycero-alpha-D-manno-heptose-7-phosphate kinase
MIICRSPLRISLGGGGTDLPSYYRAHEGFLIAGAIDKYVFVTVTRPFQEGIYLKYSKIEKVPAVVEVEHPIIREALRMQELRTPQIEIASMADIPAGTGLGSSGSFTTALLKALFAYRRCVLTPQELAERACHIEIDLLGEPIGRQDQYIAAYGGLTSFTFHRDGTVCAMPVSIPFEALLELEDRLLLFFTGFSQNAGILLQDQDNRTKIHDSAMLANLHYIKDIGYRSLYALEKGDVFSFGKLMQEHWEYKKKRSSGMSNTDINAWYARGIDNGAVGGKLVGAGGRGFLLFLAEDKIRLRRAMREAGLEEVRFHFDFEGTRILLS